MIHPLARYSLVYLGTPYSRYQSGIDAAFRDACRLAAGLVRLNVRVYSPIAHTHPIAVHGGIDPLDASYWLSFDAAMMDKSACLAIGCLDGWQDSAGLKHEIDVFESYGKAVWMVDPRTLSAEEQ